MIVDMNRYGEAARRYWAQWLPDRYARIEDPESWFAALGEYASVMIDQMADDLAGDDPEGEGYLDKVVRLAAARKQAEQVIMTNLRPRPDPDRDNDDDDDELAAIGPLVVLLGCPGSGHEWAGSDWL